MKVDNKPVIVYEERTNKKLWIPIILLSIAAIVLLIFALIKNNELSKSQSSLLMTQNQLSSTSSQLTDTQNQLTSADNQLSNTQAQLKSTQSQLTTAQSQLTSTNNQLSAAVTQLKSAKDELTSTADELTATQGQLASAQNQLNSVNSQLSTAQTQLTSTQAQLTSTKAELTLYQNTWGSVVASGVEPPFTEGAGLPIVLISNSTATNPTWANLQNFILSDKTDQNKYVTGTYTCGDYARDVYDNAEKSGIRAAFVAVEFSDGWHACDAFQTSDRGLVFIDCGGLAPGQAGPANCDKTVNVKLGIDYVPVSMVPQSGWSTVWDDMGKILDVQVYW